MTTATGNLIPGFILLQMFKEQSSASGRNAPSLANARVPYSEWKEGYIIKNSSEEFFIRKIESNDGKVHNENCTVELESVPKPGEKRTLKGASLRATYEFVSYGDVQPDAPAQRADVDKLLVQITGIREVYPRKKGEGTRVLMLDKTAYIVADNFDEVVNLIHKAGGVIAVGPVGEVRGEHVAG